MTFVHRDRLLVQLADILRGKFPYYPHREVADSTLNGLEVKFFCGDEQLSEMGLPLALELLTANRSYDPASRDLTETTRLTVDTY